MTNLELIWNFEDYITYILKLKNSNPNIWFRGVSSASYRLTPSSYRNMKAIPVQVKKQNKSDAIYKDDIQYTKKIVINDPKYLTAIEKFKCDARKQDGTIDFHHKIEWMFYAQHYGFPTCVLDWTTDPLVALYFAIQALPDKVVQSTGKDIDFGELSTETAAIYILDPSVLNKYSSEIKGKTYKPYSLERAKDVCYLDSIITDNWDSLNYTPIAVFGSRKDRRMVRQSGNFTLHSSKYLYPIDYVDIIRNNALTKILIPYSIVAGLQKVLLALDLTQDSVLPFSKTQNKANKLKENVHAMFHKHALSMGGISI